MTIEEFKRVVFFLDFPKRKVYLDTGPYPELGKTYINFLKTNINYFSWKDLDITSIPSEVAMHKSRIELNFTPII